VSLCTRVPKSKNSAPKDMMKCGPRIPAVPVLRKDKRFGHICMKVCAFSEVQKDLGRNQAVNWTKVLELLYTLYSNSSAS
jgi:hypothetical protein